MNSRVTAVLAPCILAISLVFGNVARGDDAAVEARLFIEGLADEDRGLEELRGAECDKDAMVTQLLKGEEARSFRALAARANYLAVDRPDIQFAVKEVGTTSKTVTVWGTC